MIAPARGRGVDQGWGDSSPPTPTSRSCTGNGGVSVGSPEPADRPRGRRHSAPQAHRRRFPPFRSGRTPESKRPRASRGSTLAHRLAARLVKDGLADRREILSWAGGRGISAIWTLRVYEALQPDCTLSMNGLDPPASRRRGLLSAVPSPSSKGGPVLDGQGHASPRAVAGVHLLLHESPPDPSFGERDRRVLRRRGPHGAPDDPHPGGEGVAVSHPGAPANPSGAPASGGDLRTGLRAPAPLPRPPALGPPTRPGVGS